MKLVNNRFNSKMSNNSIILLAICRNENLLIEYFIKYYRNLGITHFIFVDNDSNDGCFEYLKNLYENIMLFSTSQSYKESNFGADWIDYILNKYCKNLWCLVVDIDELIYLDNINILINSMEKENSNLCRFLLLDMYPKELTEYKRGDKFINHSKYFDKYSTEYYKKKYDLTKYEY